MTDTQEHYAEQAAAEQTERRPDKKSKRTRRIAGLILALLILLLLVVSFFLFRFLKPQGRVASVAETKGLEWVRSIYGWGRGPAEQLVSPESVSFAPDGTIWVAQPYKKMIVGFHPDGTYSHSITASDTLEGPTAVEVGPDGTFYIVESARDTIRFVSPDDVELFEPLRVDEPTCIAVSEDLFVVGAKAGFAIFRTEGDLVKQVGSFGKGEGQFDMVNGIAIGPDETIYVSDQYNNRISAYDASGKEQWVTQTGPAGNSQDVKSTEPLEDERMLQMPMKIAVDGNGRLVVVDPFDFALSVFQPSDENMEFLTKFGAFGKADGEFNYPTGLDYDPGRDVFAVADTLNNRVQIVRLPDSGSTPMASVKRALTGPIRACLFPLILLLIAIVVFVLSRIRRRNHERDRARARISELATGEASQPDKTI